jgi:hypothetical protein
MRHGRKSKTKAKAFSGFKRHLATALDARLIMACAVTPANEPEQDAAELLSNDIAQQGQEIRELYIDRSYINAPLVEQVLERSGTVACKPWRHQNKRGQLFSKSDFFIDVRRLTITCPAGETEGFEPGRLVEFDPDVCDACPLRNRCTLSSVGHGRTHQHHRQREPAEGPARPTADVEWPSEVAAARGGRTPADAHQSTPGTPGALPRPTQESVRPASCRRHPKPGDHPA